MMFRMLALVAALFFISSEAQASKLYLREFSRLGTQKQGDDPQVAREPGFDQNALDFSGGSVSSAAFQADTRLIRIVCDASCSYTVTSTSTAATTAVGYLPANVIEYVGVPAGGSYLINVTHNP